MNPFRQRLCKQALCYPSHRAGIAKLHVRAQHIRKHSASTIEAHSRLTNKPQAVDVRTSGEQQSLEFAQRSALGDRDAFRSFYEYNAPYVHGVLVSCLPTAKADDIVQDVFLIAWRDRKQLAQLANPTAWLCVVARNCARQQLRKLQSQGDPWDSTQSSGDSPQLRTSQDPSQSTEQDRGHRILRALRELPEPYAEVLGLRLVEGLSGPQIASALERSHGTIRVQLTRGMQRLRQALKREGIS